MTEVDILAELSDLDLTLTDTPTKKQLHMIYGVYLDTLVKNPLEIDGTDVLLNKNKVRDSKKYDKILLGKHETFCHIVTRDIDKTNKRSFKAGRANKVHWIRAILENKDDKRIKYFEGNSNGRYSKFYWFKDKAYIVIVRELSVDVLLVTGYCVDLSESAKFNRQWQAYLEQERRAKKNLPRR